MDPELILNTSLLPSSLGVNAVGINKVTVSKTQILTLKLSLHPPSFLIFKVIVYSSVSPWYVWAGLLVGSYGILVPSPKSQTPVMPPSLKLMICKSALLLYKHCPAGELLK